MTKIFNRLPAKPIRRRLRRDSPNSENLLWYHLRSRRLLGLKFRRQYSIGRYIVDFYCPSKKLVIEIDGDSHFTEEAETYDDIRNKYMGEALGLTVLRFTNQEVSQNLSEVLEKIHNVATQPHPTLTRRPLLRKER